MPTSTDTKRVHRMIILVIGIFMVMLITTIATGYMVQQEVAATYAANREALLAAGMIDVIQSSRVVGDHMMLIHGIASMAGFGIILIFLMRITIDIRDMMVEADRNRSDYPIDEHV